MEDGARRAGRLRRREINKLVVWLGFCLVFLLGLADWRRLLSLRNLDLIALLSFAASLWFFNRGDIFTSVPLAYPPLALRARAHGVDRHDAAARDAPPGRSGRSGCSSAATVFLAASASG